LAVEKLDFDENFHPRQLLFRLKLYADVGEKLFAGGVSTKVSVWYKTAT